MKTKQLILILPIFAGFIFVEASAIGQNKSVPDTTKQATVIYTCSMHPEIQSMQPGVCPKCGMALIKKSEPSEKKPKKHNMRMMHSMMSGMSEMENMEKDNSAEKNKITNDSTQKEEVLYTCSMHSEIQSNQPGNCPKCGMTLIKKSTIPIKKEKRHKMSSMGMGMGIGMGIMMTGMLFFFMRR